MAANTGRPRTTPRTQPSGSRAGSSPSSIARGACECAAMTWQFFRWTERRALPWPVWNPDVRQTHDFGTDWKEVPDDKPYDNAFKAEWELFIRHVCEGEPFRWNLLEGAKGLQLVDCAVKSWRSRSWVDIPRLKA